MDTEPFARFLKRSGKKDHVVQELVRQVGQFEAYLAAERRKALEDAGARDLEEYAADLETVKPGRAGKEVRGLILYYEYVGNPALSSVAAAIREAAIAKTRRPFRLKDFRGVDAEQISRLEQIGIADVSQMLEAGSTPALRQRLSERCDIPVDDILELVKLSDLSRVGALKSVRARLYYSAGVDTPEKLAAWDPEELREMLAEFVERTAFDGITPLPKEVRNAVAQARRLPGIVQYESTGDEPRKKEFMMSNWQSTTLDSNGLRVHYTRTGGTKPPLVLAHGFSDDGLCWTPVAEVLCSDYDVIMPDARGHGRSDAPEEGYGPAEQAVDLAGVIQGLGLYRPAVLGHSMGAATALVLAGLYPDLPGAILLEDPPPRWVAGATVNSAERQAQFRARITELKAMTREELMAHAREQSPTWPEAELGPWADSKLRLNLNVLNRPQEPTLNWTETLRRITCPALLITADPERGGIVKPGDAVALQALIPQLHVVQIPNAGHSIHREQFAQYMDVVSAFLAELPSSLRE